MNIQLNSASKELRCGLENFLNYFNFKTTSDKTIEISVSEIPTEQSHCIKVSTIGGYTIEYKNLCHFFRALGILIENIDNDSFERTETPAFASCSNMIDLSRNAVYTVEEMKKLLAYLAVTGHDKCYLYMEDTYELAGYSYFGYLRGKYSVAEMKEIDDFAYSLGIEAIPCIQTLAHLKTTLKWNYAANMKDTADILLVGEEETYKFIETMFVELKKIFRSNNIHIGMDEAMDLGSGKYLRSKGYKIQYDIMMEHLAIVNDLAIKHDLIPLIWDDMFYRSLDKNHEYYNRNIDLTDERIAQTPENVKLVYWDYYHNEEEDYESLLEMRDRFKNDIIFAGGIWRWMGYVPNYTKTFVTTNSALNRCKHHDVKEIMSTAWGDDGSETPIETIIPGLILFGEHCFSQPVDEASISKRCKFLTGITLEEFMAIEQLDIIPGCEKLNIKTRNPSKHILFQDILLGAFDTYFDRDGLEEHYHKVAAELLEISKHAGDFKQLFVMYAALAVVLEKKVKLGVNLRKAYKANDKATMQAICNNVLPQLKVDVAKFKEEYATVWFNESKGHGFEVIDVRLGGLMSRIDTVLLRVERYLNGSISTIEELEEEIQAFELGGYPEGPYLAYNKYKDIVTQNLLCHH
ncbi:MAG: beta-N-acetylhexosaminidase [Oscillospiraceae bacterium]